MTHNKNTTSSKVKNRYNNKVYGRLTLALPKQLVQDFKDKCSRNGVSYASVLKDAIKEYLSNGTTKE